MQGRKHAFRRPPLIRLFSKPFGCSRRLPLPLRAGLRAGLLRNPEFYEDRLPIKRPISSDENSTAVGAGATGLRGMSLSCQARRRLFWNIAAKEESAAGI